MEIGFSGTQVGLSSAQRVNLRAALAAAPPGSTLHHGDCVGADYDAHCIARELGMRVVIHPPDDPKKRAWCVGDVLLPVAPYLVRNHAIVDGTERLYACPREATEVVRSGTWATWRYAGRRGRPRFLLLPEERD